VTLIQNTYMGLGSLCFCLDVSDGHTDTHTRLFYRLIQMQHISQIKFHNLSLIHISLQCKARLPTASLCITLFPEAFSCFIHIHTPWAAPRFWKWGTIIHREQKKFWPPLFWPVGDKILLQRSQP